MKSTIDSIISALERAAPDLGIYVNSTTRLSNPFQAEASKTIAFEIVEELGDAPDWVVVPVGGGGTVGALWKGFCELQQLGCITRTPRLAGVVPRNFNLLELAFQRDIRTTSSYQALTATPSGSTVLTKLAHAHPPDGLEAVSAIRASGGTILSVSDQQAIDGQMLLARNDGIYAEPSSGTVVAAIDALLRSEVISQNHLLVGVICGSGYRETFTLMKERPMRSEVIALTEIDRVLEQAVASYNELNPAADN